MLFFLKRHLIQALINKAFPGHSTWWHEAEIFSLLPVVGRERNIPSMYTSTQTILSVVKVNNLYINQHNFTKKSNASSEIWPN